MPGVDAVRCVCWVGPCPLVAIFTGQLPKHCRRGGRFYTFTATGIYPGRVPVQWGYALVELLVAPIPYLIFGQVVANPTSR